MLLGITAWPQNTTWASLMDAGVAADRAGLDMLFSWDHFYAIIGPQENPNFEVSQVLAGWGSRTERIRIGSLVHGITYRHPAVLANMITALDHLTNGRAIMGIGAGWMEPEHKAYGMPLGSKKERSDRFEEGARVIRSMLRERTTTFSGKYYQLTDALNEPPPVQRELPVLIGGGGEQRTLRTAARYADMWHGFGSPDDLRHKIEVLHGHCAKVGRDPKEIQILGGGTVVVRDRIEDAHAYLDRIAAHQDMAKQVPRAIGDPDTVARQLLEYAKAGVHGFIIGAGEPFDHETIERVGREVKPRLDKLIAAA